MSRNYLELYDKHNAEMLQDMDDTITKLKLWDWIRYYDPEDKKGFMFSNHPNLNKLQTNMKYGGHSGSSYAWTLRNMEFIAKNGWDRYVLEIRSLSG